VILINLLPHREERRKRRKAAYFAGLGAATAAGLAIVGVWYLVLQQMTASQQERNTFLTAEIRKLEVQIKDIATLPGLKDRVTELTGFASMVVNPFDNMKLGSAVREAKLRREAPSYLTACGLAMRRFLQ